MSLLGRDLSSVGGRRRVTRKWRGFTLIEMLVAVGIFAAITAMGQQAFSQLIRYPVRASHRVQQVGEWALAYQILSSDASQALTVSHANPWLKTHFIFDMPLSGYDPVGTVAAKTTAYGEPRLFWHIPAWHTGTPQIGQTQARILSIGYYIQAGTLWRITMYHGETEPVKTPILHHIARFETAIWTDRPEPIRHWSVDQEPQLRSLLPRAVEIHLVLDTGQTLDWTLLMPEGAELARG